MVDSDLEISVTLQALHDRHRQDVGGIGHADIGNPPPDDDGTAEENEGGDDDVFGRSMKSHVGLV